MHVGDMGKLLVAGWPVFTLQLNRRSHLSPPSLPPTAPLPRLVFTFITAAYWSSNLVKVFVHMQLNTDGIAGASPARRIFAQQGAHTQHSRANLEHNILI